MYILRILLSMLHCQNAAIELTRKQTSSRNARWLKKSATGMFPFQFCETIHAQDATARLSPSSPQPKPKPISPPRFIPQCSANALVPSLPPLQLLPPFHPPLPPHHARHPQYQQHPPPQKTRSASKPATPTQPPFPQVNSTSVPAPPLRQSSSSIPSQVS